MTIRTTLCAFSVLLAVACDNDPVQDAPRAEAGEAQQAPAAEEVKSDAAQVSFAINEANSTLGFVGAKVTGTHEGSFKKFSGSLEMADNDPAKTSVKVSISMSDFATDSAKLDGHLKSPDFFDVAKFPEAKFESTKVEKDGESYKVTGNLSLHGVTKSISFPAKIHPRGDDVHVAAEFGINRKDFKIEYPGMPDDLIKDEVLIKLELKPAKR